MINIDDKITIHFPMEMKPRKQQIDLLQKCKNTINHGKKFILINAPTGSGKSYFAVMFSNWYKNYVDEDAKIDIITNSKLLQEQYKESFDYINVLKGQSNYQCVRNNGNCQEGKELNTILKQEKCTSCPYDFAKLSWIDGEIGITNFHMFNSLSMYQKGTIDSKKSNVLIIDEAHDFESVFCDFLSTKLSEKLLKKYGMDAVQCEFYQQKFIKITSITQFMVFLENDFLPKVTELNSKFESLVTNASKEEMKEYFKYFSYTESQINKFETILDKYKNDPLNWSLDRIYDKEKNLELLIEPIWGYDYLNEYIWGNYDHVIFMSGSILDREMFSYINGLPLELTDYYELQSNFAIKNRPIYYIKNIGKMTYTTKELTFQNQVPIIEKILKKYNDKNGIIHTINYELSDWVTRSILDSRLIRHESDNREDVYKQFKNKGTNSVLISPSMMSGISLDDDLSRFQIIMKVPYPNISSNKIKARQRSYKKWYDWKTCVDILQMAGRSVRSETDWADTFILDSSFSDILKNTSFFPRWFTDSIIVLK
jgi:ATP-dependent DNA helicase DinG